MTSTTLIQGIHHIAIICSNYERSKYFYTNILGFKILHETFRHERQSYKLDLELPCGGKIELFSFPNPPPRVSHPEARGLRHLAFKVADIEKTVNYLQQLGVKLEPIRIDEFTQKRFTFFKDPDDLPLEIYDS